MTRHEWMEKPELYTETYEILYNKFMALRNGYGDIQDRHEVAVRIAKLLMDMEPWDGEFVIRHLEGLPTRPGGPR